MDEHEVKSALPKVSRRGVLAAGALGVASLVLPVAAGRAADTSGLIFVYVGSYTKNPPGGGSNNPVGLSVFGFDPATGALSPVQQLQSANPSFAALDPSRRFLYVINEIDDYEGQKSGSAEAYSRMPSMSRSGLPARSPRRQRNPRCGSKTLSRSTSAASGTSDPAGQRLRTVPNFKTPAQTCEERAAGGGIHSQLDPARLRQRAPL